MPKRTIITALICLNAILATGLLLRSYTPPAAYAQVGQPPALASNYLVVSGEVQDEFDCLYLIDRPARVLHGFFFDKARRFLLHTDARSLEVDFRNN